MGKSHLWLAAICSTAGGLLAFTAIRPGRRQGERDGEGDRRPDQVHGHASSR
jgi:hypothetical protein